MGLIGYGAASRALLGTAKPAVTDEFPEVMAGEFDNFLLLDRFGAVTQSSNGSFARQWRQATVSVEASPSSFITSDFQALWSRQQYDHAIQSVLDYIYAGDCYQVNLAQRFEATFEGDPLQAFLEVVAQLNPPYAAYVDNGSSQVLSFSPELFLTIKGRTIESEPIKGTRPRGKTPQEDMAFKQQLIASEKDRAENLMIVDLLRNDLGKLCEKGSVSVPDLFRIDSFSNVHHLVSRIRGILRQEVGHEEALLSCLPGGSITGAPKIRAAQIIQELEESGRNAYCGSIYLSWMDSLISNITIRTAELHDGKMTLWGGGGIVADSSASAEYLETLVKINHIVKAFGASSLLDD